MNDKTVRDNLDIRVGKSKDPRFDSRLRLSMRELEKKRGILWTEAWFPQVREEFLP